MSVLLTPLSQALTYISTLLTPIFTTHPTAEQLQLQQEQQQKQHTKTQQEQARFKSWNALPLGHRWALESQQRASGRPSFWPEGDVDSDVYKRESGDAEVSRLGWVRWVENERRKGPVRWMEDGEREREMREECVRERERRAQEREEREREDRRRREVEVEEVDPERREVRRLRGVLERERRLLDAERRPG
ncbi:hypothetical protein Vi05172_g3053 [Venturia inaequalis]|nr:hypothetical protein Vi05172_g3053 [Venturia inaequalis]